MQIALHETLTGGINGLMVKTNPIFNILGGHVFQSDSFKQSGALGKEDLPLGYNLHKALPSAA